MFALQTCPGHATRDMPGRWIARTLAHWIELRTTLLPVSYLWSVYIHSMMRKTARSPNGSLGRCEAPPRFTSNLFSQHGGHGRPSKMEHRVSHSTGLQASGAAVSAYAAAPLLTISRKLHSHWCALVRCAVRYQAQEHRRWDFSSRTAMIPDRL
ncbi:hypothetical protein LZ32DRAFT_301033 [Colletotrichum eremochloae]|nr:hypothetical protein LZ32DRAFT_301033 [Colletotrichum eremochloae]